MNPGKVVHPARLDQHLRMGADWSPHQSERLWFSFPDDGGSFVQASSRCVGVGKCRQHSNDGHQVMCPSYQVTGDEQHSTRGRARLLYEMMNGHADGTIKDGWHSEEVRDALDLCLACKGCKADCPVGVDMATYKAEFLAHHYKGRLRPRADYALGYLPTVSRLVQQAGLAPLANRLAAVPPLRRVATRAAGLEDRTVPAFATQSLQDWWRDRPRVTGDRGTVVLWPDTFTNRFEPGIGQAAVEVLEDAGWTVEIPAEPMCCGLTWISTGQLRTARKQLRHAAAVVADHLHRGGLVVGLEPSCTAVLRSDGPELLPEDKDVEKLHANTVTFAELLRQHTPGWRPPQLPQRQAIAQVHCHQHAIMGWDDDQKLLQDAGVDAEQLESGCCGLAGNFGFTAGHGQVSSALAHRVLVPRVDGALPDTAVLADGFSCRTQIREYADTSRRPVHLAELIAEGLRARR
jgi:Fe-S oxidoreductase